MTTPTVDRKPAYFDRLNTLVNETANKPKIYDPVAIVGTGNATITATLVGKTQDSYTILANDRVLLAAQTTPAEDGIYVALAGQAPVRASDMPTGAQFKAGSMTWNTNKNGGAAMATSSASGIVGTDGQTWA